MCFSKKTDKVCPPHPTTLGTLTALTHLYHNFGLPALLGLAALCGGLTDAILLYVHFNGDLARCFNIVYSLHFLDLAYI